MESEEHMTEATDVEQVDFSNMSILESVKKNLGIPVDHTEFDMDIALHINSTFAKLYQMGVGPRNEVYQITGYTETWDDFTTYKDLNMVQSFMYIEVRLMFDPPTASLLQSLKERQKEYEWRLVVAGSDHDEEETGNE